MKTINNIIENSALGIINQNYRYGVLLLFSGILVTVMALLVFVLGNMEYVSGQFNF